MRLRMGMKKAFSLVLAGAMVITGVNVSAPVASAEGESTAAYEGAITWNTGGDGDCRIQIANSWAGIVPEETKDIEFTKAEVTFTVAGFADAGVESADAVIEFSEPTWSVATTSEPVAITADGTYTVTATLSAAAKIEQYMAVRIASLDDKYEKSGEGESEGPLKFSDVKLALYNEPAPVEPKAVYDGAITWNTGGDGDCRIQLANSWAGIVPEETKDIEFTKAEITFTVAGFADAGVESADAVIEFSEPTWSVAATSEPVAITADGTYTVAVTLSAAAKIEQYMAVRIASLDDKYEKSGEGESEGPLKFSDVKVALYNESVATEPETPAESETPAEPETPAELKTLYDGAITWNTGGDGDCRIQIANSWAGIVPEETKDIAFTKAEVTFTVAGFADAGVESADAVIEFSEPTWSVAATADPVAITADGTYTVAVTLGSAAKLEQYMAVRIASLDDKYEKVGEGESEGPLKFSDVKIVLYGADTAVEEPTEPTPSEPAAPAESVWTQEGSHAYVAFQMAGTWDYRNQYEAGKTAADSTGHEYIKAGGEEVAYTSEGVKDALITADGEYTIGISGVDLSGSDNFNMLLISTDIERAAYPEVQVTNATVKIDGKVVDGLEAVALPYKNAADDKFYTFEIASIYTDWVLSAEGTKYYGENLETTPTDSIEVTFTISGLGTKVENEPIGAEVGKKFTKGAFVYEVTKQAMTRTNGAVKVVGLSKAGKKAKSLTVANTVKKTGTYNVTAIDKNAFKGAAAKAVTLGKKIKSIPASAFANCKKLSTLTLKAKLKSVSKNAFKGCAKTITVKGTAKKANVKALKKSGYKNFK